MPSLHNSYHHMAPKKGWEGGWGPMPRSQTRSQPGTGKRTGFLLLIFRDNWLINLRQSTLSESPPAPRHPDHTVRHSVSTTCPTFPVFDKVCLLRHATTDQSLSSTRVFQTRNSEHQCVPFKVVIDRIVDQKTIQFGFHCFAPNNPSTGSIKVHHHHLHKSHKIHK